MNETRKKPLTAAQKRQRALKHRAWLRAGVQVFFFLTMPGAFVAGFSGVKHLFQWIGAGELLRLDSFVLSLIGLCGFTVLFGRFFCGYVCAFGGLGDFVYWLSGLVQKKLLHRKKQFRLPERAVRWGQKVKYLLLILIAVLCALGVYGKLTGTSPWDVFSRLTALKLPTAGYGAGIALFVLIWRHSPGSSASSCARWGRCLPCCRCCPSPGCTGTVPGAFLGAPPAPGAAQWI